MTKLNKKKLKLAYGEVDCPESFQQETGIPAESVFCMDIKKLSALQQNENLFDLRGVIPHLGKKTIIQAGVSSEFYRTMKQRQGMMTVIKNMYDSDSKKWFFVFLFASGLFWFLANKAEDKQNSQEPKNLQLREAQAQILKGTYQNPKGPLAIDVLAYVEWKKAEETNASIREQIGVLSAQHDSIFTAVNNEVEQTLAFGEQEKKRQRDSINAIYKIALNDSHLYSSPGGKQKAIKKLEERDSIVTATLLQLQNKTETMRASKTMAYKQSKNSLQMQADSLQKTLVAVPEKPPYDLGNPRFYTGWGHFATMLMILFWIALVVVFVQFILILYKDDDNWSALRDAISSKRASNHTPLSLRMLAFFNKKSVHHGSCFANITLRNMEKLDQELVALATLRKNCNVLLAQDSFEFDVKKLYENEKQQPLDDTLSPLFYTIEGDVAILYTGIE